MIYSSSYLRNQISIRYIYIGWFGCTNHFSYCYLLRFYLLGKFYCFLSMFSNKLYIFARIIFICFFRTRFHCWKSCRNIRFNQSIISAYLIPIKLLDSCMDAYLVFLHICTFLKQITHKYTLILKYQSIFVHSHLLYVLLGKIWWYYDNLCGV